MPAVENMIATLLSFKPFDETGKRLELVPTKPVEMEADSLTALWKKDKIFQHYYKNRAVVVRGWAPPEKVDVAHDVPSEMVSPHKPSPSADVGNRKPPEPAPLPSTEPIEPTPVAGVPGNAKQALASVYASVNPDQLTEWGNVETRKTVLKAIDERLAKLADVDPSELETSTPHEGEYTTTEAG